MLEAVVSHDLWFWHAYFGLAGSNNEINVLHQSPIFDDVYDGIEPECPFQVNTSPTSTDIILRMKYIWYGLLW